MTELPDSVLWQTPTGVYYMTTKKSDFKKYLTWKQYKSVKLNVKLGTHNHLNFLRKFTYIKNWQEIQNIKVGYL